MDYKECRVMQKSSWAVVLAASLFLTGCGHSGGSGDYTGPSSRSDVEGPLDPVQQQVLEDGIFDPLTDAVDGTAAETLIEQLQKIVNDDLLDILDAYSAALVAAGSGGDGAIPAFTEAGAQTQEELHDLVVDLQGLLQALAGAEVTGDISTGNPLAGTPLEAFGQGLNLLLSQLEANLSGSGNGEDIDLQTVADLVAELAATFNTSLDSVPASALDAPLVGPTLTLLGTALTDLHNTTESLADYEGAATATGVSTTLTHLLNGLFTQVIPIAEVDSGAADQIAELVQTFVQPLQDGLAAGLTPVLDLLDGPLAPLLDPIENNVLTLILGPVSDAIHGNLPGVPQVTGNANLDSLLSVLTGILNGPNEGPNPICDLLGALLGQDRVCNLGG
jgi:hypothetical protein